MKFASTDHYTNSPVEFQVTCAETIEGAVLAAVKQMVYGKEYLEITLQAAAESNSGNHKGLIRTYSHCKVYSDAVDFSSEDVTAVVLLRIVYNWAESIPPLWREHLLLLSCRQQ
nr:hypothetical protein [Salmonella sp.]